MDNNLTFSRPAPGDAEAWEEKALDDFREDNWLGRPETSVEMRILDNTRVVEAESARRLRAQLDNPQLMTVFRDISIGDLDSYRHNPEIQGELHEIEMELYNGNLDVPGYVQKSIEAIPEEISLYQNFSDVEFEGLDETLEATEEIQENIENSDSTVLTGADLLSYTEGEDAEPVLQNLEQQARVRLYIIYGGNEEAVQEYGEILQEHGIQFEGTGVPGEVFIGKGEPYATCSYSSELSLEPQEIEEEIME